MGVMQTNPVQPDNLFNPQGMSGKKAFEQPKQPKQKSLSAGVTFLSSAVKPPIREVDFTKRLYDTKDRNSSGCCCCSTGCCCVGKGCCCV